MYRVKKVLNHNAVLAVHDGDNQECLILGKGIGFGKKVTERIETGSQDTVYYLQQSTERGDASKLASTIAPECLEIANEILNLAEGTFGKVDRNILFPMADHIEYAVKRVKNHEQISNPLTEDIRILFHAEYNVAKNIEMILKERMGIQIDSDEIGYIALHIHSAIDVEKVSQAMQMAQAVRECVTFVEKEIGRPLDVMTLSYNRLMNHIRYMVARALSGEVLKLNMNDYIGVKFPKAFQMAQCVCDQIGHSINCTLNDVEIGYLAMHIERVMCAELDNEE